MMWGSGLEDGNKQTRENLPFIFGRRGGGRINVAASYLTSKAIQA
jgi:hypothetical protein